jgi:aminoglycoside phosphotransferase (APT) family kinase protein
MAHNPSVSFAKPLVTPDDARRFLDAHHDAPVDHIEAFATGHWSAAFGYEVDGERLVVRFGRNREWYEVDQAAHAYDSVDLPVPRVREIGEVTDGVVYAISERKDGVFLEDTDGPKLRGLVTRLLDALRSAPLVSEPDYTWRGWLEAGIDPAGRNAPWRALVAQDAYAGPVAVRAEDRVRALLDGVVDERRELVHGDLLHKNVLVAPDLSAINAVFSWKCSARGDSLFDLAWITFWAPWYPGIAALGPTEMAPSEPQASLRHHCYELYIGLNHLSWFAQVEDRANLHRVAGELERRLDERR